LRYDYFCTTLGEFEIIPLTNHFSLFNRMTDAEYSLRKEIIVTCLAMEQKGINQGTSGNVSVRWNDGLLITASGLAYETSAPEDIIFLEMDGTPHGPHNPSSEWRFHRDILRERPDIHAIVHAHPIYCTAQAITGRAIPAVHYMIAAAGGPTVRCAPYATFGTDELSNNAIEALRDRQACLLANHGLIACGPTLRRALWLAGEVETLAKQYALSLQLGDPVILPDDEIARVIQKFKTSYGPKSKAT
jgi:L-fuculose-phosphate aldolase